MAVELGELAGELAGLADFQGRVTVSELLPRGVGTSLAEQYDDRATDRGWIAAALLVAMTAEVLRRAGRREVALYLATGSSPAEVAGLQATEAVVATTIAVLAAVTPFLAVAGVADLTRTAILHGGRLGVVTAMASVALQLPGVIMTSRRVDVMEGLKQT